MKEYISLVKRVLKNSPNTKMPKLWLINMIWLMRKDLDAL